MTTMAATISIACCPCDCCAASAVPANAPRTFVGRPMSASACLIARLASSSVLPSARLNEIVVASSASWWLIEVGVARSRKRATAESGTSGVTLLLSALPVDGSREPGLALTRARRRRRGRRGRAPAAVVVPAPVARTGT